LAEKFISFAFYNSQLRFSLSPLWFLVAHSGSFAVPDSPYFKSNLPNTVQCKLQ